MKLKDLFFKPESVYQKKYEILRAAVVEELPREEIAKRYKVRVNTVNSYVKDLKKNPKVTNLFSTPEYGRKGKTDIKETEELIIKYRKSNLSVPDIKAILDSKGRIVSEKQIYNILKKDGFIRLPRRNKGEKAISQASIKEVALKSEKSSFPVGDIFTSQAAGIFCLIPYLQKLGIIKAVEESNYPMTGSLNKVNSILSFVALKLSNFGRYTTDDQWCMDSGLGLFAGLNVLPKAAWYSSYSHRVTRDMNLLFLRSLNKIWKDNGYISDTANLDFSSIPYWGEDTEHLSKNWSGTRNKSILSILAALAQDPDTGIITYGDTTVDEKKDDVVLEFLDFSAKDNKDLKWVVFDSKFTTYGNLSKINQRKINFITIRRRGSLIVKEIENLPKEGLRKIRISTSKGKRDVVINDSLVKLREYEGEVRQIAIVGNKRLKPALIITNNLDAKVEEIVGKYAKRWLVEKEISEQIYFFHLNKLSSSIVIKVDFDLVMTMLSHNLCRVLAQDLEGYETVNCETIFNKFFSNSARIRITKEKILIELKKKRELPLILTAMAKFNGSKIHSWDNKNFEIQGWTTS